MFNFKKIFSIAIYCSFFLMLSFLLWNQDISIWTTNIWKELWFFVALLWIIANFIGFKTKYWMLVIMGIIALLFPLDMFSKTFIIETWSFLSQLAPETQWFIYLLTFLSFIIQPIWFYLYPKIDNDILEKYWYWEEYKERTSQKINAYSNSLYALVIFVFIIIIYSTFQNPLIDLFNYWNSVVHSLMWDEMYADFDSLRRTIYWILSFFLMIVSFPLCIVGLYMLLRPNEKVKNKIKQFLIWISILWIFAFAYFWIRIYTTADLITFPFYLFLFNGFFSILLQIVIVGLIFTFPSFDKDEREVESYYVLIMSVLVILFLWYQYYVNYWIDKWKDIFEEKEGEVPTQTLNLEEVPSVMKEKFKERIEKCEEKKWESTFERPLWNLWWIWTIYHCSTNNIKPKKKKENYLNSFKDNFKYKEQLMDIRKMLYWK